jgi:integrase
VLNEIFGSRDVSTLTSDDVTAWLTASSLKPSSLRQYTGTLRQVLDYAGLEPNPARDRRVRLPRIEQEEINPPSARQFLAILEKATPRWRLPLLFQEQTGMRSTEIATLTWGDVDLAESQVRVSKARSKTGKARWVQVPAWLTEKVSETLPLEDRLPDRRVFPGCSKDVLKAATARACKLAGVGDFSPHELRHRWISLQVGKGVPITAVSAQVGHSRTSMTLDTYSHVLMDASEVAEGEAVALLSRTEVS